MSLRHRPSGIRTAGAAPQEEVTILAQRVLQIACMAQNEEIKDINVTSRQSLNVLKISLTYRWDQCISLGPCAAPMLTWMLFISLLCLIQNNLTN